MKKPLNKKATMKDIAREADVSVATVSYILNNVNNQTISEETRCRVLEVAKHLNYVPNLSARSLVKGKSGLLGLLLNRKADDGFWKQLYYGMLSERLESICKQYGYHLIVTGIDTDKPNIDIMLERELDGVFLVDVKSEVFSQISNHFKEGVPLVILDSLIDDPLFFKVVAQYETSFMNIWKNGVVDALRRFLVIEAFNNEQFQKAIISAAGVPEEAVFVVTSHNHKELPAFLEKQKGKKGAVVNEFIGVMIANMIKDKMILDYTVICSSHCPDILPTHVHCLYSDKEHDQARLAGELMLFLLNNDETLKKKLFPDGVQQRYLYSSNHLEKNISHAE